LKSKFVRIDYFNGTIAERCKRWCWALWYSWHLGFRWFASDTIAVGQVGNRPLAGASPHPIEGESSTLYWAFWEEFKVKV
jgi:hypothetical protein